ncbi:hypothetical protein G7Y89_g10475 [Cudoniella acicularis]|uniref:Uncharacterized protein n=1 Tax=Cudoniella acicularis TaxID=354080 RepID=A0A8H4RF06_9HELO|nr:hypothetical protein G7Y89_g10475 [Cudoniella acicularis]
MGETPQHQGSSNQTKHNAEHPGPDPPRERHGTDARPTKGGSGNSPEASSAQSGGSRSKEAKETGSSPTGGSVGQSGGKSSSLEEKSRKGAKPKIYDHDKPSMDSAEKKAEVEKHNREFEQGHDRAPRVPDDKVDKKFRKGHGGADREA